MNKFFNLLAKNSPTILTGLSVTGLITTTLFAVKATPKALQLIEQEKYERHLNSKENNVLYQDLSIKDTMLLTWKCYVPAAVMGAVTIGCIIGANSINLRRNAALASVYSISEAALKEYKTKVVETIGKNKEQTIKDEIAKDRIIKNPVSDKEVVITGLGETLCYDSLSGRYFKSDIEHIRRVLNDLSRDLISEMEISLNQVYDKLGLSGTKIGDLLCWHVDNGLIEPEFSSQLTENGTPCLVLDFTIEPRYKYIVSHMYIG